MYEKHIFLIVSTVICIYAYYYNKQIKESIIILPPYPNDTELYNFINHQINLVNRHNKYEIENGFVNLNSTIKKCEIPSYEIIKQWWMNNTLIKEDVRDKNWRKRYGSICIDYPLFEEVYCNTIAMHNPYEYDSLFVSAKFCDILAPRPKPIMNIINESKVSKWNNNTQKYEYLINLEIFIPNGSRIGANDDRIKFISDGNGCELSIKSINQLILSYDNNSGYKSCYKEIYSVYDKITRRIKRKIDIICDNPICKFGVNWNWVDPNVNSVNISYWLTRQPIHQYLWYNEYVNIELDSLIKSN